MSALGALMQAMAVREGDDTEPRQTSEHSRILVIMARFVGAGFGAYFLTCIPSFGRPAGLVAGWFTPVGVIVAFGPGLALLAISFVPRLQRWIPPTALLCTTGYLLACALWMVAWTGGTADAEQVTWLMTFSGLPSLAWALVRPVREAFVVLVVCAGAASVITDLGRSEAIESNVLVDAVWAMTFTICFLLAAGRVVRTGRLLDRTRAEAMAAAADAAAVAARNTERARFDALIHDQVIATLVAAYRNPGEARLPAQAQRAIEELHLLAGGLEESGEIDAGETLARLRAVVASADPDVSVLGDRPEDSARYPVAVVRALAEAVGEAVRNSVDHAGPDAARAVLIEMTSELLCVTVADDGVGFEPDSIAPERLGIEVSIRQRLRRLDGAAMALRSAPGEGTVVQMRWERG